MKKKTINMAIAALSVSALLGAAAVSSLSSAGILKLHAEECEHQGYHYHAKEATFTDSGYDEFWSCCKCHQSFLDEPLTGTFEEGTEATMTGGIDVDHVAYIAPVTTWEERVMQSGEVFEQYFLGKDDIKAKADRANHTMTFEVGRNPEGIVNPEDANTYDRLESWFDVGNKAFKLADQENAVGIAFDMDFEPLYEGYESNFYAGISSGANWQINYDEGSHSGSKSIFIDTTKYDLDGDDANASYKFMLRNNSISAGRNCTPSRVTLKHLSFVNTIDDIFTSKAAASSAFSLSQYKSVLAINNRIESEIVAVDPVNKTIEVAAGNSFRLSEPFIKMIKQNYPSTSLFGFRMLPKSFPENYNGTCTIARLIENDTDSNVGFPGETDSFKSEDGSTLAKVSMASLQAYNNFEFLYRNYSGTDCNPGGCVISSIGVASDNIAYDEIFNSVIETMSAFYNGRAYTIDPVAGTITALSGSLKIHNSVLASARAAGYDTLTMHIVLTAGNDTPERLTVVSDGITSEEAAAAGFPSGNWSVGFYAEMVTEADVTINLAYLDTLPSLYYKIEPQKSDYNGADSKIAVSNIVFA